MGAGFDRAPPRPLITLGERSWHGNPLTWSSAPELWGPTTYTVFIDGKAVGTSPTNKFAVPRKVRDGRHRWAVGATDRRGQSTVSKTRRIRLDRRKPTLNVKISGARKRGSALRISARAHDRRSGVRGYRISFGGRGTVERNHATHVFRGRHATVTVSARDRAGNVAVKRIRLTLK
jgi:hypothetical protein